MGRKRQNPLGLPERVYAKHGAFYYVHPKNAEGKVRWEPLGQHLGEVKRRAAVINSAGTEYGTMRHWLDRFLLNCESRVRREELANNTLRDYKNASILLKIFFGDMQPAAIEGHHVARYLDLGAEGGRPVRANREKACLSSCFTWMIRSPESGVSSNPCLSISRNPEAARERYIEDDELRAVMQEIESPMVKAIAGLIYRTLQRPGDIQKWTAANIVKREVNGEMRRVIKFQQSKTKAHLEILITPQVDKYLNLAKSITKNVIGMTLLHKGDGQEYAEKSLSSMFASARRKTGIKDFRLYDLKAKGATDMWLSGVPLERIQVLCGHESVTTTERYVKCRWRGVVEPNQVANNGA